MNKQEFFDAVVTGLIKQGAPSHSVEDQSCMYRGPNGLKCAIGLLIPDEEYEQNPVEGVGVDYAFDDGYWPTLNNLADTVPLKLMSAMQEAHDGTRYFEGPRGGTHRFKVNSTDWLSDFKSRAKQVAEVWGLNHEL